MLKFPEISTILKKAKMPNPDLLGQVFFCIIASMFITMLVVQLFNVDIEEEGNLMLILGAALWLSAVFGLIVPHIKSYHIYPYKRRILHVASILHEELGKIMGTIVGWVWQSN